MLIGGGGNVIIDGDGFGFLVTAKTQIQREKERAREGEFFKCTKEAATKGKGGGSSTCGAFRATKKTWSCEAF